MDVPEFTITNNIVSKTEFAQQVIQIGQIGAKVLQTVDKTPSLENGVPRKGTIKKNVNFQFNESVTKLKRESNPNRLQSMMAKYTIKKKMEINMTP